ncbi:MAG: hypothetical protein HGA22_12305, partial [Clostridiales bacterium]|nr:hypothetical protein [Clostridiales bacterium]
AAQIIANALILSDGKALLPKIKHNSPITLESGASTIDSTYIYNNGGTAIQDTGTSELVVRNSFIKGDTSKATAPLAGPPGGLLVSGNIRTTLALSQSQAFYINSEVVSKNWAALSTDGAVPITEAGQKELALYTYGSNAKTVEGGYGAYSDLFCNLYVYGSKIDASEISLISGTYGPITVGTIGEGEANAALAKKLTDADKSVFSNKNEGSVITGGRNAIMIHSVSLPPYWGYEGYSQEKIPFHVTKVSVSNSTLATNLSLDKGIAEYSAEQKGYIAHHKGSVIVIKSSNAEITLDKAELLPDPAGTGAVIHTMMNNDTMFMMKVPEGETYPGTTASLKGMNVTGNILNEDYQRDMALSLKGTTLTGSIVSGTAESWNAACKAEGFESYIADAKGYATVHGVKLTLDAASAWYVTGTSSLVELTVEKGSAISAPEGKTVTMTVDGKATEIKAGTYKGTIVISVK